MNKNTSLITLKLLFISSLTLNIVGCSVPPTQISGVHNQQTQVATNSNQITTQINTPLPTRWATQKITNTPRPTLYPIDAEQRVLELLKTNGGCNLPCFWGVTPGESNWDDTEEFLSSFAIGIERFQDQTSIDLYVAHFSVPDEVSRNKTIYVTFYVFKNIILEIVADLEYSYSNIIDAKGKPDEIWLYINTSPSGPPFYDLSLFYSDSGVLMNTNGQAHFGTRDEGIYLIICPNEYDNLKMSTLWLWSSSRPRTFIDVATPRLIPEPPPEKEFFNISSVTNASVEEFSEATFSNDLNYCFESMLEHWSFAP